MCQEIVEQLFHDYIGKQYQYAFFYDWCPVEVIDSKHGWFVYTKYVGYDNFKWDAWHAVDSKWFKDMPQNPARIYKGMKV